MFQFFKKSGHRDRPRSLQTSPLKPNSFGKSFGDAFNGSTSLQTPTGVLCSLEEEEEDDAFTEESNETCSFSSQLSKSLPQILADKGALGYFIQFMDTKNSIALIKFWLEVECLCGSLGTLKKTKDTVLNDIRSSDSFDGTNNVSNSFDNNKNISRNNYIRNNTNSQNKVHITANQLVNSEEIKFGCKNMPKINEAVSESRQSHRNCGNRNYDTTTAKQDALKIYKKYIAKEVLGINRIPEELKLELDKALTFENMEPILQCLSAVQKIVYNILETEYIHDFLRSEFHCKHQIDVLTSGDVQLADILYNETAFFYFMEFMELENKRELLDFWMSAINYKQNLLEKDTTDPEEAQTDALILYDKYFSLQATMPLGFSDKVRFQVEQNICSEDGEGPRPDCFDKPRKIVYNFLNKHYLPTFLSSQLYYKYLSELISTIQNSPCPNVHARVKRAGSDCSSEVSSISVNMQGTLQAGHDRQQLPNNKPSITNSLSIDSRQLYDPDSLWKRNKYSLSVGYIDDLGRFITEIEPDPHKKYESRLARAVKRLVNMDQDKAKEELAWKIAEMIVREITSLTLGTSNLPS